MVKYEYVNPLLSNHHQDNTDVIFIFTEAIPTNPTVQKSQTRNISSRYQEDIQNRK